MKTWDHWPDLQECQESSEWSHGLYSDRSLATHTNKMSQDKLRKTYPVPIVTIIIPVLKNHFPLLLISILLTYFLVLLCNFHSSFIAMLTSPTNPMLSHIQIVLHSRISHLSSSYRRLALFPPPSTKAQNPKPKCRHEIFRVSGKPTLPPPSPSQRAMAHHHLSCNLSCGDRPLLSRI